MPVRSSDSPRGLAAAVLAGALACSCGGASEPGGAVSPPAVVGRFEGRADPATGQMEFRIVPAGQATGFASVMLPGDTTPGRGSGTPDTVELATEWVSYTDLDGVTTGGHPCGKPGSLCALVTMRSYYAGAEIHDLYAQIETLSPTDHDGFAVQPDPGGLDLNGVYGLWAYPALLDFTRGAIGGSAPGANAASVVWYFNNTSNSAFTFTGSIMGTTAPTGVVNPTGYDAICGGSATSLRTIANCGECGRTAPAGTTCSYVGDGAGTQGTAELVSTVSCAAGGQTACMTAVANQYQCVDLQTDAANCGVCGNACSNGGACVAGICTSVSCPAGTTADNLNGICVVSSANEVAVGSDFACLTASQSWLQQPGPFVAHPTYLTNVLCWGNSHLERLNPVPSWPWAVPYEDFLEPPDVTDHSGSLPTDLEALTCGNASCVGLSASTAVPPHTAAAFFFGDYWNYVQGVQTLATQLSMGTAHGVAIYPDLGTPSHLVLSWGAYNDHYQIGYGNTSYTAGYPNLALPALGHATVDGYWLTASAVAAGGNTSCAVLEAPYPSNNDGPGQTAGTVACWGQNGSGQASGTAGADVQVPTVVAGVSGAIAIDVGTRHSVAYDGTNLLFWGDDSAGQFGGAKTGAITTIVPGRSVSSLSAGGDVTCYVSGGTVYCAGQNGSGQLGQGDTAVHSGFVAVPGVTGAVSVSAGITISGTASTVCAVTAGAEVYCWGDNSAGQLGIGAAGGHAATPVLVQMQPL